MANNRKILKSANLFYGKESYTNMFKDCINLEEVDLTNVKNKEDVKFTTGMFNNCKNIEKINMSNWDTSNIVDSTDMFSNVPNTVDWNYAGPTTYANFTLTETDTNYSGTFPWK